MFDCSPLCSKQDVLRRERHRLRAVNQTGDREVLQVGCSRMVLAPLMPLLLMVGGIAAGLNPGAVAVLSIVLLLAVGLAVMGVVSPGVVVQDGRLSVPGREDRRRAPGGSVDLTALVSARSVSYQGGRVSGRGLAVFRFLIWLEDADGGQAMFLAWGWSPKAPLQAALRNAVAASHARMDPMTWWRFGFRNGQGARTSVLRRFV